MNEVKYLGTIVTPDGIRPDSAKVEAVIGMPTPTDKAGVRRILGMINFLAAHVPDMSTVTAPVHDLQWGPEQAQSLDRIKKILSTAPVLSYFDPNAQSMIQVDAGQYGLGACLFQKGKPVAYASRSLLPAECNYAQIKKELLAIVFAFQKFHNYIYGFRTKVQTDHKPLESVVKKALHKTSPCLQRMLLKLQKYNLIINYVKGKDLHVADALSRAHLSVTAAEIDSEEIELPVHTIVQNLPQPEHEGMYYCSASNEQATIQSRIVELTVLRASAVQMSQKFTLNFTLSDNETMNDSYFMDDDVDNNDTLNNYYLVNEVLRNTTEQSFIDLINSSFTLQSTTINDIEIMIWDDDLIISFSLISNSIPYPETSLDDINQLVPLALLEWANVQRELEEWITSDNLTIESNEFIYTSDPLSVVTDIIQQICPSGREISLDNNFLCGKFSNRVDTCMSSFYIVHS